MYWIQVLSRCLGGQRNRRADLQLSQTTRQGYRPWRESWRKGGRLVHQRQYQPLLKGRPRELNFITSTINVRGSSVSRKVFDTVLALSRCVQSVVFRESVAQSRALACSVTSIHVFTWCSIWSVICMLTLWSPLALKICPLALKNSLIFRECSRESPVVIKRRKTALISPRRARVG